MAMTSGGTQQGNINVTPLIDVLLVLLIIFMVIQPTIANGLQTLIPQPPKHPETQTENPSTVVLEVRAGEGQTSYLINSQPIAHDAVANKLREIFAARADKVMFVKGDAALDFATVVDVIDAGHAAGVDNIGIITPQVERGI